MPRRPAWGLTLILAVLAVVALPLQSRSAAEMAAGEAEQLGLADALLAEGDFFRAITEFKRFLFLFPASPQAVEARLGIADAYLGAGRYGEAEAEFASFRREHPAGPESERALFGQALALLGQGRRSEGRELLRRLLAESPEGRYRGRAQLELALSLAEEGQWARAQEELAAVSEPGPRLERRLAALKEGEAAAKSPAVAGLLSALLPGAGQAYCGRIRDGALALLINGLFIWAAAEAGLRGNYELAAGLGLVEALWYGGTIYGALNCAYRHEREEAERVRRLLEREPEAETGAGMGAVGGFSLAWGCRF